MIFNPSEDVALHGMLFAPREGGFAGLLIGFGGNGQDADELGQDLAARFPSLHVAVFHYRGYGPSSGRPSERAVLADALLIHDELTARLQSATVLAYGVSLGTGVAAYLAKERSLDGAFLITPYDSIEAVAKEGYPWLPVGPLFKHRFPSVEFLQDDPTPIAIIAAELDQVITPARTEALRAVISNLVFDDTIEDASHAGLYSMPAFDKAVAEAFEALKAAIRAR
jgi:pimeloyl-ACP methyl ester carboxylesterase